MNLTNWFKLIVIGLILFFGCNSEKYEEETNIFAAYLQENFQESIGKDKHFYLLSNSYVCKNCLSKYIDISDSLLKLKHDNITLISTNRYENLWKLTKKIKILEDKQCALNYENLNLNNFTLFTTQNGKIVDIRNFGMKDINSFIHFFDQNIQNKLD